MAMTRYVVPISESSIVLESRRELNQMAEQYPMSTMNARNGDWYMLNDDGTVLAVASDYLCAELDASIEDAMQLYGILPEVDHEVRETVATQSGEQPGAGLSNTCSHPRWFLSSTCRTFSGCYVCESNLHICV